MDIIDRNRKLLDELGEGLYYDDSDIVQHWDENQELMYENEAHGSRIRNDTDSVLSEIDRLEHMISFLREAYGDLFENYLKERKYPATLQYYLSMADPRYRYSDTMLAALDMCFDYLLSIIQGWGEYEIPGASKTKTDNEKLTEKDIMQELVALRPDKRSDILRDVKGLSEVYMLNRLEQRRQQEQDYEEKEKQQAIERFRRIEETEAEKLAAAKESREGLRDILKQWVRLEQTAV